MDFEEYVRTHTLDLLRASYLLAGSKEAAEDLTQEALLQIHRKWDRVRTTDNPTAYCRKILINRFLSETRRPRLRTVNLREDLPTPDTSGLELAEALSDKEAVRCALAQLPARQRTALVLRYYLQLSDTEIAEAMSIQPATARSTIARALRAMHGGLTLQEENDDEDRRPLEQHSEQDRMRGSA